MLEKRSLRNYRTEKMYLKNIHWYLNRISWTPVWLSNWTWNGLIDSLGPKFMSYFVENSDADASNSKDRAK